MLIFVGCLLLRMQYFLVNYFVKKMHANLNTLFLFPDNISKKIFKGKNINRTDF